MERGWDETESLGAFSLITETRLRVSSFTVLNKPVNEQSELFKPKIRFWQNTKIQKICNKRLMTSLTYKLLVLYLWDLEKYIFKTYGDVQTWKKCLMFLGSSKGPFQCSSICNKLMKTLNIMIINVFTFNFRFKRFYCM